MKRRLDNGVTLIWFRTEVEASFASRRLLSLAVREFCADVGENEKDVSFDSMGKPYFTDFPGYYLSITHSADLLLYAFAPFPIGVDAEKKKEERPSVASRYFSPEEMKMPFSQVWTGREAVGKLTGMGLSHALSTTVFPSHATLNGVEYCLSREEIHGGEGGSSRSDDDDDDFVVTLAFSAL